MDLIKKEKMILLNKSIDTLQREIKQMECSRNHCSRYYKLKKKRDVLREKYNKLLVQQ